MSDERNMVTLADRTAAWNFGPGVELVESTPGSMDLRPATRWERLRSRLAWRLLRATRWFRPRTVCSAIDVENGIVTLSTERWSWRRWRWERV